MQTGTPRRQKKRSNMEGASAPTQQDPHNLPHRPGEWARQRSPRRLRMRREQTAVRGRGGPVPPCLRRAGVQGQVPRARLRHFGETPDRRSPNGGSGQVRAVLQALRAVGVRVARRLAASTTRQTREINAPAVDLFRGRAARAPTSASIPLRKGTSGGAGGPPACTGWLWNPRGGKERARRSQNRLRRA